MKKYARLIAAVFCLVFMFTFTACSKGSVKNVILSDVLVSINNEFEISSEEMLLIEDKDTLELYYNISPSDVKQFAAETTLNSATDITEIIIVEAVNMDAARRVYEALDVRYNSQRDLCASYSAELLSVINGCSVEQNGNYVCLIMSDEFDNIFDYYSSFFR